MDVGKPKREIYVEPLELPEPLRQEPAREPERTPDQKPQEEPAHAN